MKAKIISAREIALQIVGRVLDDGAYANIEAHRELLERRGLSDLDRRFILELAYGTVKHWNTLDWILSSLSKRPLEKIEQDIMNILRLGAYQILYLDRVPDSAACNESVALAKRLVHHGAAGFVNGVLRNLGRRYSSISQVSFPAIQNKPVDHISLKYSHPRWLVERWIRTYGLKNTLELCAFNNRPPVHSVRVNTLAVSIDGFKKVLADNDIEFRESQIVKEGLIIKAYGRLERNACLRNLYLTQSEGSMLVAHKVDPRPGDSILDACAAPGAKSTHLAQRMANSGEIIALDIHEHRVALIENNCRRLGITCIYPSVMDAREAAVHLDNHKFDAVLVDAPCSGTGVLNRRPDARWRKEAADISRLSRLQVELLEAVIPLVKPGGKLVYSTCSLEPEENEGVIEEVLKKSKSIRAADGKGYTKLLPFEMQTDGFFIASLTVS